MTHHFRIHDTTPPVRESVCIFASGIIFALIVIGSLMAA